MRQLWRVGVLTLLAGGLALGCTRSAVRQKQPPDPLLTTKKPVEGRPRDGDKLAVRREVEPPPMPAADPAASTVQHPGTKPLRPVRLGIQAIPEDERLSASTNGQ